MPRKPSFQEKVHLACWVATDTGMSLDDAATQVEQASIAVFPAHERWDVDEGRLMLVAWAGLATCYEAFTWENGNLTPHIQSWTCNYLLDKATRLIRDLLCGGPGTQEENVPREALRERMKRYLEEVAEKAGI